MSYSHFKIFQKYCMPLRKFKEETGRLDLHSLSQLPWGSDCQKSKSSPWEFHIHMQPRKVTFHQTPQEENDPKGCETRPSIYYKPKFIYKAATQLLKSYYPYLPHYYLCVSMWVTARNILREFARENMEVTTEDVDPTFPLKLSSEEKKVRPQRVANHFCPDFGISQTRKYF